MPKRMVLIRIVTAVTLASGIMNLYSVIAPAEQARHAGRTHALLEFIPLRFFHVPRSFTLLLGFALVVSAVNLLQRKRRAFQIVLGLAVFSVAYHLARGPDVEQAALAAVLAGMVLLLRRSFTVWSAPPDLRHGLTRLAVAAVAAFGYGAAGFWLLDRRDFGIDFTWSDAFQRTLRFLTFVGDPSLTPHTHHARWFLESLSVLSATVVVYAFLALYRPLLYRFHTLPHDRERARAIVAANGRSVLDYFKLWPDKSFFFNRTGDCFIAYRYGANMAVGLGDPVGPPERVAETLYEFQRFCDDRGWVPALYQTTGEFLGEYRKIGFKKLKVGDDAVVDLAGFSLDGKAMKKFRYRINSLEREGVRVRHYAAPVPDEVLDRARVVSDEWLRQPGRRERTFSLGRFDREYLRTTPIFAAEDVAGRMLAFVNLIPSGRKDEATFDLMRHGADAPNGVMDYVLVKLILDSKEKGFTRFNLGLAPMAGFAEREESTAGERAVHLFFQRLTFLFSFGGIKTFKAKYATAWEPRYVVYRSTFDLPRLALALGRVSELRDGNDIWEDESGETDFFPVIPPIGDTVPEDVPTPRLV